MKYLLDTHVFLWWLENPSNLSKEALKTISNNNNIIYISSVTIWEIAIKKSIGKLKTQDNLTEMIEYHNFSVLNINIDHAMEVENLPFHHRDPFDRLLISQSKIEDFTIITRDEIFKQYEIKILQA